MFPLSKKKIGGYKFGVPTFYSNFHLGVDYEANYVPLLAPFNGIIVKRVNGTQGGKTIWFRPDNNNVVMRFLHLSEYPKEGRVKEGEKIGVTGNTGTSPIPHLHLDISKGDVNLNNTKNFIDPEKYNWSSTPPPLQKTFMKITIVANKNTWTTLNQQLITLSEWIKTNSTNRLECVFDVVNTNFDNVPLSDFQGYKSVDIGWYRENITPLATGEATIFLLNPQDYQNGNTFGYMTYGDTGRPVRMEVTALESELPNKPEGWFVERAFHEICHALFFLTDKQDYNPNTGSYVVHDYLYQDPPKRKEVLDLIDYQKLQNKLVTINPQGDHMLVYKFDDSQTVYVLADDATLIGVTGTGLPKVLAGRPQKLIVLAASQRVNFKISTGVIN